MGGDRGVGDILFYLYEVRTFTQRTRVLDRGQTEELEWNVMLTRRVKVKDKVVMSWCRVNRDVTGRKGFVVVKREKGNEPYRYGSYR